jgi:hypothetical protein
MDHIDPLDSLDLQDPHDFLDPQDPLDSFYQFQQACDNGSYDEALNIVNDNRECDEWIINAKIYIDKFIEDISLEDSDAYIEELRKHDSGAKNAFIDYDKANKYHSRSIARKKFNELVQLECHIHNNTF